MHFKTKYLLSSIFTFIVLTTSLFSQNKKVLLVPYTRFQFVSEFSLEEIAKHNKIKIDEVFPLYQEELKSKFSTLKNESISFISIEPEDYVQIKKYIRYNIDKFKGRKYNASNLSMLPDVEFKSLLEKHNASHIMFVNWYNITKSVHTVYIGDRNKRAKYSSHLIDYDVYNKEKEKVLGKGNAPLKCGDFPSQSMINNKSLNAKELAVCYNELIDELVKSLTNSSEK